MIFKLTRALLTISGMLCLPAAFAQGGGGPGGGGPGGGGAPDSLGIYTFTGAVGTELTWPVDAQPANATFSVMRRGSGVQPAIGANAFNSVGWTQATAADTAQYYAFSLTAAAGTTLNLDSLGVSERRSATGIQHWEVRSSLDGFATALFDTPVPDSVSFRKWSIPLPAAFDALTTVEFRFYGYSAEGTSGTWRLDNVYLMGAGGTGGGPVLPTLMTIAAATQNDAQGVPTLLNQAVRLRGTIASPNTRTAGYLLTLIDNTGGITVFRSATLPSGITALAVSDSVEVTGTITQFNGLTELVLDSILTTLPNQSLPTPTIVTTLDETTESELVKINGPLTLVDAAQWTNTGSGFNVDVTDGSTTYQMRIVRGTDIYGTAAPTQPFRLVGIGGQFDTAAPYFEGYQIAPRALADIQLVTTVAPEVAFGQPTRTVAESVGTVQIPVTITNPSATDPTTVWVRFADVPGTATPGTDYTFAPQQLTFPAGSSAPQVATLTVLDDSAVESDETVNLVLDSVSTGAVIGSGAAHVLTITDNDTAVVTTPHVEFASAGQTVSEGAGTVQIPVMITNPSATTATTVVVRLANQAGTATAGADYTFSRQVLTFPAGSSAPQNVTLTVIDDVLPESIETVRLRLDSVSTGATIDSIARFVLGIVDNDTTVSRTSVEFASATQTVGEGAGMIHIPVTITNPNPTAATTVRVRLATVRGTATPGVDYTFSPQVLTFPAGSSAAQDVMLTIIDDNVAEAAETIRLRIDSVSTGVTFGTTVLHVLTIADDDSATGPMPPLRTIAAVTGNDVQGVALLLGQNVRVRGIVLSQNLRATGYQSALQDRTGGVGLFAPATNPGPFPAYGDSVEVVGRLTQFRGLTQVTIDSFRVLLPSQPIPAARLVTTLDESTESELVQIAGPLTLLTPSQWNNNPAGFTADATDGTRTYVIRVSAGSQLVGVAAPTQPFRVWGVGSQFATTTTAPFLDGYQILVRFTTDIGLLTGTTADAPVPTLALYPNPATDRLTVLAPAATTVTVYDALGRAVRTLGPSAGTTTIAVAELRPGVYTVRAGALVQRFVKE